MDLSKLFEMQKALDARIEKEHPREDGEDRLAKKLLALQVELGECANEWRGFKFWSNDQEPRKKLMVFARGSGKTIPPHKTVNPLLEEFVDVLHFSISIATEFGLTTYKTRFGDLRYHKNSIIKTFSMVFQDINELLYYENAERYVRDFLDGVLGLGYKLGFSFEEIEAAYIAKNQTNHVRQDNGY